MDATDTRLVLALSENPRATVVGLAESTGLSRNTVQARLARLEAGGVLAPFDHRIRPEAIGYPLTAFISTTVTQQMLDVLAEFLAGIPEVVEVFGVTGSTDLLIRVAARDADDLYRIAGLILASPGTARSETALAMRTLVPYRTLPLVMANAVAQPDRGTPPPRVASGGDRRGSHEPARKDRTRFDFGDWRS